MLLPSRVAGRTLGLRGPDLARGPGVARLWPRRRLQKNRPIIVYIRSSLILLSRYINRKVTGIIGEFKVMLF